MSTINKKDPIQMQSLPLAITISKYQEIFTKN